MQKRKPKVSFLGISHLQNLLPRVLPKSNQRQLFVRKRLQLPKKLFLSGGKVEKGIEPRLVSLLTLF